ncbi:MAG: MFS transporter [Candidatus Bathyarchaeota archaeon]|nr:MFS transporter [Candidatus Bathyarchaeota archaeon]
MMALSKLFQGESAVLRGNFLLITLSWIIMFGASPISGTYASLYYKDLGASDFLISIIGVAGSLAIAIVQLPGGYLADKHGRRWLVVWMTFGLAIGSLFFVFAPSWHFIVLGMIIQNICAIYGPALMAMVFDSLPPQNRGAGFSFQSAVTNLVYLPGPLIASFLVSYFGFTLGMRVAYAILTIAYFAAAMLRLGLKETLPANGNSQKPTVLDVLRDYPRSVKDSFNVWRKVPKSAFYLFLAIITVSGLVVSCMMYFVVYATSVLQMSNYQWAIIQTFMYLSIFVPVIAAGFFMDKIGRKHFLIAGYLLCVPGMLLFLNGNFYTLLLAFFLFGLGNALQLNSYQILMGDLIPRSLRGTATGCMQFFAFIMQAVLLVLVGFLYAFVAPWLPFLLLAVVMVPVAVFVFLKVQEPTVKEI